LLYIVQQVSVIIDVKIPVQISPSPTWDLKDKPFSVISFFYDITNDSHSVTHCVLMSWDLCCNY